MLVHADHHRFSLSEIVLFQANSAGSDVFSLLFDHFFEGPKVILHVRLERSLSGWCDGLFGVFGLAAADVLEGNSLLVILLFFAVFLEELCEAVFPLYKFFLFWLVLYFSIYVRLKWFECFLVRQIGIVDEGLVWCSFFLGERLLFLVGLHTSHSSLRIILVLSLKLKRHSQESKNHFLLGYSCTSNCSSSII